MAKRKSDLETLQGSWTIVTLQIDGAEMPPGEAKIVIKGDKFTTLSMGATYNGIVTLDATASPKTFDLKFTAGPEKGNTSLGIYELDGNRWKICLTVTGNTRPQAFATAPGSGLALETLRRDTAPAAPHRGKAAADHVQFEPIAELQGEWSLVSLTLNGKPLEPGYVKYGKRVVKDDLMTVTFGRDIVTKAKMSADPAKYPKIMDYTHVGGMMAGQSQQGIYELEGKILRVCSAPPGQTRPTEFTATPENGRTLTVWTK